MNPNSSVYQAIDRLNNEEIVEKIRGNYYNDEVLVVAKEILLMRGVAIPAVEEDYIKPKIPFRKSHPIWFWTFFGAVATAFGRLIKQWIQS
jgi:hypothetical protein